jgi:hypothetical protein
MAKINRFSIILLRCKMIKTSLPAILKDHSRTGLKKDGTSITVLMPYPTPEKIHTAQLLLWHTPSSWAKTGNSEAL